MTQASLEQLFLELPQRAVVAVVARAARRISPLLICTTHPFDKEVWEWLNATSCSTEIVEAFVRGMQVSRFTLDVAAEFPRLAASSVATASRRTGPSRYIEQAEVVFAVAAFAADTARAETATRRAKVGSQAISTSLAGDYAVEESINRDLAILHQVRGCANKTQDAPVDPTERGPFGPLWHLDEPTGWAAAWSELAAVRAELPRFIMPPGK